MPADLDRLSRDDRSPTVAGDIGRSKEVAELPILLRIPRIAAAMQETAQASRPLETAAAPQRGSHGAAPLGRPADARFPSEIPSSRAVDSPAVPVGFDDGFPELDESFSDATEASHPEFAGVGRPAEALSSEKSWTERVGSKIVLVLVMLAVAGVAITATQNGPDLGDLPDLSADLHRSVGDGAVASASHEGPTPRPIEPSEDVYGRFDFSSTEGIDPVSIDEANADAARESTDSALASDGGSSPEDGGGKASKTPDADEPSPAEPALQLTAPAAAIAASDEFDESAASAIGADRSAADDAALQWPAPEPIDPAHRSTEENVTSAATPQPATQPAQAEEFAPLATATAGPIDWAQFDPLNRAAQSAPHDAVHGHGPDPSTQQRLAAGPASYGTQHGLAPRMAAAAPQGAYAGSQPNDYDRQNGRGAPYQAGYGAPDGGQPAAAFGVGGAGSHAGGPAGFFPAPTEGGVMSPQPYGSAMQPGIQGQSGYANPYGTPQHSGAPSVSGTPPNYGGQSPHAAPSHYGDRSGHAVRPTYGAPSTPGAPQAYGAPPSQGHPPTYGAPPNFGGVPTSGPSASGSPSGHGMPSAYPPQR